MLRRRAENARAGRCAGMLAAILVSVGGAACGAVHSHPRQSAPGSLALPADLHPIPIGRGPSYRLPAISSGVAGRMPIAGLRCSPRRGPSYGIHLELYAHRLVVPVPAGIGIAPPQRRSGAYVLGGACVYPIRTFEPTGVAVLDRARAIPVLGQLFAVWGQPLSRSSLAGFPGPVLAYVDGRRWAGRPDAIVLRRHAEIVLEVDGAVPPHPTYAFPSGL